MNKIINHEEHREHEDIIIYFFRERPVLHGVKKEK